MHVLSLPADTQSYECSYAFTVCTWEKKGKTVPSMLSCQEEEEEKHVIKENPLTEVLP
jgi:hypothetical protein